MSSIYDDKKNLDMLDGGRTPSESEMPSEQVLRNPELMQLAKERNAPKQEEVKSDNNSMMQQSYLADYIERSTQAMKMVDDIVLKSYLTKLSDMEIMPLPDLSSFLAKLILAFLPNRIGTNTPGKSTMLRVVSTGTSSGAWVLKRVETSPSKSANI